MATPKAIKPSIKPSSMLGFLLFGFAVVFVLAVGWQAFYLPAKSQYRLTAKHWVVVVPAATAFFGWLITSLLTLRNSIKQHTITTLLQSRLSATYMGYADKVGAHYSDYDKRKKASPEITEQPTDGIDEMALRYILNYFEFLAIGIKRGEFDEEMLRDSLRGILKKNVSMSRMWIAKARKDNPNLYIHVVWLHGRWHPDDVRLM
ncbi:MULTISPECIES: DUF4760 domain-containing protein [unclassified Acidovorax]|jgi:uncharacterized membrane protein YciS (DUF1049 family)|uniref:DUF4760 domain-containing protein n=1 Tax=unclassified Acidovorax TaxID=2684926 RepID=UPI001C49375A|nr:MULTISPECIES: DUF4760 domain-containing protein [unclassified Acidovorax]MBV7460607.1 DUF4760 domain-containing protein [Acidovorax sp. sif0632]MBV7465632.1 DUF4760 domain-containing protein [Acidovorax sp. sif0613]